MNTVGFPPSTFGYRLWVFGGLRPVFTYSLPLAAFRFRLWAFGSFFKRIIKAPNTKYIT
jgi:hypothetical protein